VPRNLVPLFPPVGGVDLGDAQTAARFAAVLPYGRWHAEQRWALEGLYNEKRSAPRRWALLTRGGAVEFGGYGLFDENVHKSSESLLGVLDLEESVIHCAEQVRQLLVPAGLLAPPLVVSLRLLNVGGAYLVGRRGYELRGSNGQRIPDGNVYVEPALVHDVESALDGAPRRGRMP
jgi:hypothetical protein